MGVQKSHGSRPVSRGQRFLVFALFVLFCVFSVQYWVHEQRFATRQHERSKSGYVKEVQSTPNKKSPGQLRIDSEDYDIDNSRSSQDFRQDNPHLLDELMETVEACEDAGGKLPIEECRMRLRMSRQSPHQPSTSFPRPPERPSRPSSHPVLNPTPRQEFSIEERVISPEKEAKDNDTTTTNTHIQQQQQENLSIDFMALKDVKEPALSDTDTTWFLSSIRMPLESGRLEMLEFPSELSQGRLLCLKGSSTSDGTLNQYGFAPKERLPDGALLMPGTTLVSDQYWDYGNIWHGMSALASFGANRKEYGCRVPQRLLLYHWGEITEWMSVWGENLLHAAFGRRVEVDTVPKYFQRKAEAGEAIVGGKSTQGSPASEPVACLEHAIVNRRGLGRSSTPRLQGMFEILRCRTWRFCQIENSQPTSFNSASASTTGEEIQSAHILPHVTLYLRTGARAFTNTSEVIRVLEETCDKNKSRCTLEITHTANLTFCQQVALMRRTDVLVTTHGAQMTNAMFMPKGASIMEFMAYGWTDLAGIGQYIYNWLADWTELRHEGYWRDPEGPKCPYPPTETLECFLFYKDRQIGFNSTYMVEWMNKVLDTHKGGVTPSKAPQNTVCPCNAEDEKQLNTGQI